LAERTEAKVAMASTSVPPAVASEEIVAQSAMARENLAAAQPKLHQSFIEY
jgi:hypothetical protein